jgi:hypothetical protein
MRLNKTVLSLILAAAMSPLSDALAFAQQPVNDVDTPITVVNGYTNSQKLLTYRHSVQAFLDNVKKNHPALLPELTDFFNTPQDAYGGESRGFHNFKAMIETRLEKSKTDGSDPSKINALTVVAAEGSAYHQTLVNKSGAKRAQ